MNDAILLESPYGTVKVHSIGATVLSWVPTGGDDVLYVSPGARFEDGRAIRGGIPICWPWFADAGTPAHGLARNRPWSLLAQHASDDAASAEFGIEHDDGDWAFSLRYRVRVDRDLTLELVHEDRSGRPRDITGCLHTYFRLDPSRATVHGLSAEAFDKVAGVSRAVDGPLALAGPLDLVVPHDGPVTIHDGERRLHVESEHHRDVVLWNPGPGASVSDLPLGEEAHFACVETAIVSTPVEVAGHGRLSMGVRLRREP